MKKLKVILEERATGKKLHFEFPIKGSINTISVNRLFDSKVKPLQNKHNALLYHYEPIELDTELDAYCKKEKKEVKVHEIYGFREPKCKCGSKVVTSNAGTCSNCESAKLWLVKTEQVHSECILYTFKCPKCGYTDTDVLD